MKTRIMSVIIIAIVCVSLVSSCYLFFGDDKPLLLTFLPEDEDFEAKRLDFHAEDGESPEWGRAGTGGTAASYYLKPIQDNESNGTADLTLLTKLGTDFRLSITFQVYDDDGNSLYIDIPSVDGPMVRITVQDGESSGKEVVMTEFDGETSGESAVIGFLEGYSFDYFENDRWYTLFIDVERGSQFTIDIDERDGGDDSYDDDVLRGSYTFFGGASHTFKDPTFKAKLESTPADEYRIGQIYYKDCTDGYWPDMHGDEY